MSNAIWMLSSFTIGLMVTLLISPETPLQTEWAARILFFFAILPGLFMTIREARLSWRTVVFKPVNTERLRSKRLAILLCLVTPLIYSFILNALNFPLYGIFLWDYIFALPVLLVLLPTYVRWSDQRLQDPEDSYASLGRVIQGKQAWSWPQHKSLLLAWAVKTLFIPVMYGGLQLTLYELIIFNISFNPGALVAWLLAFGLSFDLIIATIGYICSSRLLATEVRSTDDTWSGWLVCMICYPPLLVVLRAIREQADTLTWDQWLTPDQPIYWLWAALIVLTWGIYWMSTASFGVRFSNLTYRGLIAHGPYRYTKHPSYISKNIYWWLHTVPFVGVVGFGDLARNVLGLGFVSLIYYLRAKTEERHLSKFPEYRAYREWIATHGLWARSRRWIFAAKPKAL